MSARATDRRCCARIVALVVLLASLGTLAIARTDRDCCAPDLLPLVQLKSVASAHELFFMWRRNAARLSPEASVDLERRVRLALDECSAPRRDAARLNLKLGYLRLAAKNATAAATINPLDVESEELAETAAFFVWLEARTIDNFKNAFLRETPTTRAFQLRIEKPFFLRVESRLRLNPGAADEYFSMSCTQQPRY